MANTIGALDIAITANTAAFVAGTTRARRELASFSATANTALASADRGVTRLIARYASWTIVMATAVRTMREVAKQNDEVGRNASRAIDNLARSWNQMQRAAAPALTFLTNRLADVVGLLAQAAGGVNNLFSDAARQLRQPMTGADFMARDTAHPNIRRHGGIPFASAADFPSSISVTPSSLGAFATNSQIKDAQDAAEQRAKTIRDLEAGTAKFIADMEKKLADDIRANLEAEMDFRSQQYTERVALQDRTYQREQDLLEEQDRKFREISESAAQYRRERYDDAIRWAEDLAAEVERSFDDIGSAITDLVNYGITNFERLGDAIFTVFEKDTPSWLTGGLGGLNTGLGIGSAMGTPIGGGIGGALGGAIGGMSSVAESLGKFAEFLGPIGALVGAGIGALIQGKPSDMRAVATFGPGGTIASLGAQSAHEYSADTVGAAQQAAALIADEMQALAAMGVSFTQQLASLTIGARDVSTYTLQGGSAVGVGTIGDPSSLASGAIGALLAGATSSDPKVAAILSQGGSAQTILSALQALEAAEEFSAGITQQLLEIEDPLKAALALWQREADARRASAAAYGADMEHVRQLEAALKSQIYEQYYGATQSSLTGFIQQLQYGPGSTLSPQQQFSSAFSAYDAARTAALANPTPESVAQFISSAGTFLPIARAQFASSETYAAFSEGALSTAQQLQSAIASMITQDGVTAAITATGATQVAAIETLTDEVRGLRGEQARQNAQVQAMLDRVS